MATQVILLERVEKLGTMGDVVSVKPGYARNYLIPQKKALRASKANVAYFEAQRKVLEAENDKKRAEAEKLAKKVEGVKVPLIRQASESGQLFGSVTTRDIAAGLSEESKVDIARSMVDLNTNFKTIGLFDVEIILHPEVKVRATINIARSAEEAEIQAETGKALISDGRIEDPVEEEDDSALEDLLEEGALEAQKERQAEEEQKAAEDAEKSEAKSAKRAEKKAAKAVEDAEDDVVTEMGATTAPAEDTAEEEKDA